MDLNTIEGSFKADRNGKTTFSTGGMVSTAFPLASQAGADILKKGGNAVDAAVAAAFALSVCESQASGLGGQTMAVIHINGQTISIDGSSRVPSLAQRSCLAGKETFLGYRATTVPSTPAVLGYLHLKYGRLSWHSVLEPAVLLAREGYRITRMQSRLQERELSAFLNIPSASGAKFFLKDGEKPFPTGSLFKQPDLFRLLEIIAEQGPRSFYLGPVAERIDEDMRQNDGFLRAEDLALIPWPVERPVVEGSYRGLRIATMPPPGAGRALLLVLLMLNNYTGSVLTRQTPDVYHLWCETFRKAFLQRNQNPVDPNRYLQSPDRTMTDPVFARKLSQSISSSMDPNLLAQESMIAGGETTHISVMDSEDNVVSLSQSIESIYGSKAAAEGLGFMYNNYLNTLTTRDPSHPYFLRPNAVPWSSVAPAIVFLKGKPWLAVGSPGSDRIYSTIAQFLSHIVDGNASLYEAMKRPRLHCSLGGEVSLEADRFESSVIEHLSNLGYQINRRQPYSFYLGAITAVMRCQTRSGYMGVAEIRRDGIAAGV